MPPNIQRKRKAKLQSWKAKDKEFIEIMKQYGCYEKYGNKFPSKLNEVWPEISTKINMPAAYCKRKWLNIKHNYFKLKNMIHIGRVTEHMVMTHAKTAKYLDGRLSFLDPYIFIIPHMKLSFAAQRFYDSVFGANTSSRSKSVVDAEKLIEVKENSYIEVIEDFKSGAEKEPTSILPNIENEDSDKQSPFVLGINEIKQEKEQEDDTYEFSQDTNGTLTQDNVQTNATGISSHLEDIMSTQNRNKTLLNHGLAHFLVKYANTTEADQCDLREYMNNLAEVLCTRLIPEKRKAFLCKIDLIVSGLLEGT